MSGIGKFWREIFEKYGRTILKLMFFNVVVWIVVVLAVRMNLFGVHDFAISQLKENFVNDHATKQMNQTTSLGSFFILMWHNFAGNVLSIALALIPLPLFLFQIIENPASIGFILGVAPKPIFTFVLGVLPHSLFELPMQWLSFSIAITLFIKEWRNIREKKKLWSDTDFREILKIIGLIILPLAIVSGLIETFITPLLLKLIA
jgi:uncharacterized membrane protein SpoIIM required for sporulation